MRTATVSSRITISPEPIAARPIRSSMVSPADRCMAITLPFSRARMSRTGMIIRSSSTSTSIGMSARAAICSSGVILLWFQVDRVLAELIHRGDHARVGLISALIDDQIGELLGDIDVGCLDGSAQHRAAPAGPRQPDRRKSGDRAGLIVAVADGDQ